MKPHLLIAALLNVAALSAIFISHLGWKCEKGYMEATLKYMTDAPSVSTNDDDDATSREAATIAGDNVELSYLQWDASPVEVPSDWAFETPSSCENTENAGLQRGEQKIIVHYHMQHNAGTNLYSFARHITSCATRACWQTAKHCLVSYNEETEAENIRQNYEKHGVQYVSYEIMLPPRFPLPFVSETAREGLYFTTIVRDPFKVNIRIDIILMGHYCLNVSHIGELFTLH